MSRTHTSVLALAVAAILAAGAVLAGCGGGAPRGPALALTLAPIDGGATSTRELRGRAVVLHVFSAWSLAAQSDVPQLVDLAAAEPRVAVIGVGLDPEGRRVLAPWRTANRVGYLVVSADDAVRAGDSPLGRIAVVPTTIVLDPRGRVVARVERQENPTGVRPVGRGVSAAPSANHDESPA